jgi:hypothetical protein
LLLTLFNNIVITRSKELTMADSVPQEPDLPLYKYIESFCAEHPMPGLPEPTSRERSEWIEAIPAHGELGISGGMPGQEGVAKVISALVYVWTDLRARGKDSRFAGMAGLGRVAAVVSAPPRAVPTQKAAPAKPPETPKARSEWAKARREFVGARIRQDLLAQFPEGTSKGLVIEQALEAWFAVKR